MFNKTQHIRFEVYNENPGKTDDEVGYMETTLDKIVTDPRGKYSEKLDLSNIDLQGNKKHRGRIIIRAETVSDSNHEVHLEIHAKLKSIKSCIPFCRKDDNP